MKDVAHCVLCGHTEPQLKPTKLAKFVDDRMQGHSEPVTNVHMPWVENFTVICDSCGFKHSSRRYTLAQEQQYYHDYGSGSYLDQRCRYEGEGLRHTFCNIQPGLLPQRRDQLTRAFQLLPEIQPRSVIDWGGLGRSVPRIWDQCQYYSLDISGVELAQGWLPDCGLSADLIISQQVLEHVSDPWAMIREMALRLNPGGYLYIEVPNEDEFFGAEMIHEHINGWSPLSLTWVALQLNSRILVRDSDTVNHYLLIQL